MMSWSGSEMTLSARTLVNSASLSRVRLADRLLGATHQQVGLDADLPHLHHRVLGRLGLQLAGGAG